MKHLITNLALLLGVMTLAPGANAQNLMEGKHVYPLGEPKTWTNGDASYTFVTEDLAKLTATPTNTTNVYLYPENGAINNAENQAKGAQAFYVDMEQSQNVQIVNTTWEGAAADSYNIYLTDAEPTLDILSTTPTYSAINLGQYTANTAILPEGSKGRYLVFEVTKATNWGWGVKIRSIAAFAPVNDALTTFTVTPGIAALGQSTPVTVTAKNQNGLDMSGKVTVTVSDNATYADGILTVNSGTEAVFTAKYEDTELTSIVYVATAPSVPDVAFIKTPIFTNGNTSANGTAGYVVEYNGGAKNFGRLTFGEDVVAQSFGDVRCVFFHNSETTGAWNGSINPAENGYRSLRLSIFGAKAAHGEVDFEGTDGIIDRHNYFDLKAGQWNDIEIEFNGETRLANMSIRFDETNMCDILLANVYFTPTFVEGDETAPVLSEITAVPATVSVALTFSAEEEENSVVVYTVKCAETDKTYTATGTPGEAVTVVIDGLEPEHGYTFTVTANDGKNFSEAKNINVTTLAYPAPETPKHKEYMAIPIFAPNYGATVAPTFDSWGSTGTMRVAQFGGEDVLMFENYMGQYGGLVDFEIEVNKHDLAKNTLHIDIYSDYDGSITVAPVWKNAAEKAAVREHAPMKAPDTPDKAIKVEGGKWNSFNIPVSEFGYPEGSNYTTGNVIHQMAFTQSGLSSFAVTNLYVHFDGEATGVENVAVEEADATVDVYSVQGVVVRQNVSRADATLDLTPGLYIIAGKNNTEKVLVR